MNLRKDANEIGVAFLWFSFVKKEKKKEAMLETSQLWWNEAKWNLFSKVLYEFSFYKEESFEIKLQVSVLWTTISLGRRVKDDQVNFFWGEYMD